MPSGPPTDPAPAAGEPGDADHPARAALDALFRADPHARQLGIELVDWGLGWAEVRATPAEGHANLLGGLHGGFVFSMGDVALAYAANSWGRRSTALSVEIHYLRPGSTGSPLRAVARCRHRSRRVSSFAVEVFDAEDRLLASLQGLNYRTDEWHFDEASWPSRWRAAF
jgi:acyl-CoA thioesterase